MWSVLTTLQEQERSSMPRMLSSAGFQGWHSLASQTGQVGRITSPQLTPPAEPAETAAHARCSCSSPVLLPTVGVGRCTLGTQQAGRRAVGHYSVLSTLYRYRLARAPDALLCRLLELDLSRLTQHLKPRWSLAAGADYLPSGSYCTAAWQSFVPNSLCSFFH